MNVYEKLKSNRKGKESVFLCSHSLTFVFTLSIRKLLRSNEQQQSIHRVAIFNDLFLLDDSFIETRTTTSCATLRSLGRTTFLVQPIELEGMTVELELWTFAKGDYTNTALLLERHAVDEVIIVEDMDREVSLKTITICVCLHDVIINLHNICVCAHAEINQRSSENIQPFPSK